jgi:putative SOS response-associated peptidase YedK
VQIAKELYMCGRFTLSTPAQTLQKLFDLPEVPELSPRYNIAPSEMLATVRLPEGKPSRELALLRWGLIPPWAEDPDVGNRMINARAETVATSPAFRGAFRRRRCLVPADGFYEWQRQGRHKQPYYLHMRDGSPFAFAGLWEHWKGPEGKVIESCTLITTEPSDLVRPVHNRMPVILAPDDYALWLDPGVQDVEPLKALLRPYPPEQMEAYPVSQMVNSPANDDPACVAPLAL